MRTLLLAAVALMLAVPALALAARPHARVWLADASPLLVRGSSFKARERVVVTVTDGTRLVRTVTATRTGVFAARWASAAPKAGCQNLVISAVGNRGSVASFKIPGKECPPPPPPAGQ
jgi:hypothetical protein